MSERVIGQRYSETQVKMDQVREYRNSTDAIPSRRSRTQSHASGQSIGSKRSVLSPSQVSFTNKMSLAKSFSRRVLTQEPRQQITESRSSWGPMVGRDVPRDEEDEDMDEELFEEIIHLGEKRIRRSAKKNVRAKMGFWKLMHHDYKIWLRRWKNKSTEIPVFKSFIKDMESNFGSGIGTFFVFSQWVVCLNMALCILWLGFLVIPTAVWFDYSSVLLPFSYSNLIDGAGPVAESWLFYCAYTPQLGANHLLSQTSSTAPSYHSGLMYLLMIIVTYFGSLLCILISMASGQQPRQSESMKARYRFTLLTLSSWDHSIMSSEAVKNLSVGITSSLKDNLYDVKAADLTQMWSRKKKFKVYARRAFAWLITIVLVGGGCTGIVYLVMFVNLSTTTINITIKGVDIGQTMSSFETYITPIAFSLINMIIPTCLSVLPKLEQYTSGKMELNVTLARVFILRMANLFALIMSLYNIMNNHTQKDSHGSPRSSVCTGTVLGQELYKLVIMDTIIHTAVNAIVKFGIYFWSRSKSEFDISSSVLVLIYRQALIWMGTLFCPVMPFIGTLSELVFFFLMYGTIKHTCKPPIKRWAQSRNTVFFMSFLLLSLICILVPVSIIIGSGTMDIGKTYNATIRYGPFSNVAMPTSAYFDFVDSLQLAGLRQVLTWSVSNVTVLPLFFTLVIVLIYQGMRISGERRNGLILQAELQQEREDNKNLMKKLKDAKRDF